MGGLFGSITVKGNRLTDMVGQTSAVGRPIPFGFGYCNIDEPNVIWTAGIPKEHVKKKKQGKGGVKTEEYSYTLSYAIAFMAGPVYGFLTIKRGGKIVYTTDPNASVDDKAFAAKWKSKARLYLGTDTQMPDATIESYVGAGKVSAFRDLCYIVVVDDDVTSEGGAVPQYEAVIIASPPDIYLTSHPFPILYEDTTYMGFDADGGELRTLMRLANIEETNVYDFGPQTGELREPLVKTNPLPDASSVSIAPVSGSLYAPIVLVDIGSEKLGHTFAPTGGSMETKVVSTTVPPEASQLTFAPTGGSLA